MKTIEMNVGGLRIILSVMIAAAMLLATPMVAMADDEPNDDYSDAEPIHSGDTVYGSLDDSGDEYDYYSINLQSGDTIIIELSGTGDDFDLELGQAAYSYYYTVDSSVSYGSDEDIEYEAYTSGTYYIGVLAASGSGTYTLSVDVSEGGSYQPGDGTYYVGGPDYVSGQPLATLPTLNVGSSAYFGGIKDIGEEFKGQIDEALEQYENMGIDVSYDISGGAGAYFGWEVASNNAQVNGHTCYDIHLMGAVAINVGFKGSVDGTVSQGGYTITVDGSGDGFIEFEAKLDGHLFLTVDELAMAKLQFTITAEGEMEIHFDLDASMMGERVKMNLDMTGKVDGARLDFLLEFDPPLDIFQFGTGKGTQGIYQGKTWYVPPVDTEASGSIGAQGTITYDVDMEMVGEDPVHEADTVNLATEIGDNDYSTMIPGGEYDYWGGGGVMFECTYASGDIFIIETSLGDAFGIIGTDLPFPGTRQFDTIDEMLPSTGMQYDKNKGMVTGMTMGGEAMTEEVSQSEVQSFTDDPLGEVTSETGGRSTGAGAILLLLIIVVVVVVVIVVVVVMLTKKKAPPQQYQPQPQYQQPPPPPAQYPPQDQYGQYQQQGQYPPPPPPPPGQ